MKPNLDYRFIRTGRYDIPHNYVELPQIEREKERSYLMRPSSNNTKSLSALLRQP
jgi:hypothetical protein